MTVLTDWVVEHIRAALRTRAMVPGATYSGYQLARIRRAHRISRDFEASAPATALILQLLDELENLRKGR